MFSNPNKNVIESLTIEWNNLKLEYQGLKIK
jgi:hypothetical protein